MKQCTVCLQKSPPEARFCQHCGAPLPGEPAGTEVVVSPPAASSAAAPEAAPYMVSPAASSTGSPAAPETAPCTASPTAPSAAAPEDKAPAGPSEETLYSNRKALAAFVLSLIGAAFCFGFPFSLVAFFLSLDRRPIPRRGLRLAARIISVAGLLVWAFAWFVYIAVMEDPIFPIP